MLNMFKVKNKDKVLKLWTYYTYFSIASIVDFEQVNVCWDYWAPQVTEIM